MLERLRNLFRRETRASGGGFTSEIMAARESWIAGRSGLGELTATVQSCVSLWEGALGAADVSGTPPYWPGAQWRCAGAHWRYEARLCFSLASAG